MIIILVSIRSRPKVKKCKKKPLIFWHHCFSHFPLALFYSVQLQIPHILPINIHFPLLPSIFLLPQRRPKRIKKLGSKWRRTFYGRRFVNSFPFYSSPTSSRLIPTSKPPAYPPVSSQHSTLPLTPETMIQPPCHPTFNHTWEAMAKTVFGWKGQWKWGLDIWVLGLRTYPFTSH